MRLNGIIRALESGPGIAFTSFVQAEIENAVNFGQSSNDGLVFELEHNPWDITALRNAMQFLLQREQIVKMGSLANPMTPMVRIPASGSEMNQWFAKQALDLGNGKRVEFGTTEHDAPLVAALGPAINHDADTNDPAAAPRLVGLIEIKRGRARVITNFPVPEGNAA